MDIYDQLRDAILNRQQIIATYHGHRREMCPHILGYKSGRRHVLFFQFGGTSGSGLPASGEWRCMDIDELHDVEVRDGQWHTGLRHLRPQTCVDLIDMEVDY